MPWPVHHNYSSAYTPWRKFISARAPVLWRFSSGQDIFRCKTKEHSMEKAWRDRRVPFSDLGPGPPWSRSIIRLAVLDMFVAISLAYKGCGPSHYDILSKLSINHR